MKCKVENCEDEVLAKGYCSKHYMQIRLYGKILNRTQFDPNEIIMHDDYAEIVLYDKQQNEIAKTKISLDKVYLVENKRCILRNDGYVVILINNHQQRLHRYLMDATKGQQVDHISKDTLDNRNENLRICSNMQNQWNKTERRDNKSGFRGVYWKKDKNKWESYITVNGKRMHLGYFNSIDDAIKCRKDAEIKYYNQFSPLLYNTKEELV